jgi:class 3 adenylate cyclase
MSVGAAAQPKHVMVIDDEADAREMVGDYLSLQGFTTTLCDGGATFRNALAACTPDIVLLDLQMPDEDGLSLIRFIKHTTAIPVIMLTAMAGPIDRVVALEMGADDYLTKPCELRELLARIRSVFRRTQWSVQRIQDRRLAAIVSFDIVGFSRSIRDDEGVTLAAIDRVFAQIVGPSLGRHRGTLFKMLGDGALAEFASVVDAIHWSLKFQQVHFDHPFMLPRKLPMRFRLGMAVGDVVVSGSDRLGEAVALAVRVQEIASPGSVAVSNYARKLGGTRIEAPFLDLGLRQLKHIDEPMRVWEWHPS